MEGTTIDSEKVTKYVKQHGWNMTGGVSILGGLVSTDMINQAIDGDTEGAAQTAIKGNQTLNVLNNLKHVDGDVGALNLANLGFHGYDIYKAGGNIAQVNGMSGGGVGVFDVHVRAGTVDNEQTWTESYLSQFNAANGNVIIGSDKDVNLLGGTQINAGKSIMLNAGRDLNIAANEDTYKYRDSSMGVTVGYNGSWYVGADYSKAKTDSTTYTNANLQAGGDIITISGRDTNIAGANLLASKQLDMTVGRDLNVETLQNSTQSSSYGASVTASYGAGGSGTGSAGASLNASMADRTFADNQTTLIGQEGVRVRVGGKTHLTGSMIANIDADGVDQGNLRLETKTLELTHLVNKDDALSVGVSASFAGKDGKTPDGKSNGSKGTLSVSKKETYGVTYATIGKGDIIVGGEQNPEIEGLNRDVHNASVIFKAESSQGEVTVPIPESIAKPAGEVLNQSTLFVLDNFVPTPANNGSIWTQPVEMLVGGRELMPDTNNPDVRYSLSEVREDKSLLKGITSIFINGILNNPQEAANNAHKQTPDGTAGLYNESHGALADLLEVGWNKTAGEYAGIYTAGVADDIAFSQLIKEVNQHSVDAYGHSQGGHETYLMVREAPEGVFAGSTVQLSGAPVNERKAKKEISTITGISPIIQNNQGDFVGIILGNNAQNGWEAAEAITKFPLLFTDMSPHSNYDCQTCRLSELQTNSTQP